MNQIFRSPFRYPGSKAKLLKYILPKLGEGRLVEPFVGGGSVFLAENRCWNYINDKDERMYKFWHMVFKSNDEEFNKFLNTIRNTEATIDNFNKYRQDNSALSALFLNRWTFSGILTSGPIGGYEQKSKYKIGCRFNKDKIIKLIQNIRDNFYNIEVTNFDFSEMEINSNSDFVYIDPPYYDKGDQLYPEKMNQKDHERLVNWIKDIDTGWLLSYDNCEFVWDNYNNWATIEPIKTTYTMSGLRINTENKQIKHKKNVKTKELLIYPRYAEFFS